MFRIVVFLVALALSACAEERDVDLERKLGNLAICDYITKKITYTPPEHRPPPGHLFWEVTHHACYGI